MSEAFTKGGRFDYVRVMMRVAPGYEGRWTTMMMDCVPEEYKVDAAVFRRHGKLVPMYDGKARHMSKVFEVWGIVADRVMTALPKSEYKNITRVDWRTEVPDPPVTEAELYTEFKKVKTNARRTVQMYDSPIRTKEDGRDAGGVSVIVGTPGSKRRLACYKRGKERYALEVQFGDGKPQEMLEKALDLVEHSSKKYGQWSAFCEVVAHEYEEAILAMTGHTLEEFRANEFWQEQNDIFVGQELLLKKADDLWNKLDPQSQEAFISSKADGYAFKRPAPETAEEMIRAVAPITYTDDELYEIQEQARMDREQGVRHGSEEYNW